MKYQIAYLSYNNDDKELKERSISILNDFFICENYKINNDNNGILFIASGGSEQIAVELTRDKNNIILLCHRETNSYAATIEIAAYLRSKSIVVSIIDVLAPGAFEEFVEVQKTHKAIDLLSGQKAAIIGEVSNWLIISDIDNTIVKDKLGIDILRLPWNQLDDYKTKESSSEFISYFLDFDETKLAETSKVYKLLEDVVNQYSLSAISVECFSMVRRDQVTACLPLAVLNTNNVVAACEGDVCSMIGSMIIRALGELVPWQANVAEIKEETILFAHCTAPLNCVSSFNITTHYESNCGTAIQGKFIKRNVGVFRINNKLDKYMLLEGEIVDTPSHSFACRTQAEFRTTKAQTSLLKNNSLGNHHLIFPAEFISILKRLMSQLQIDRVE
mgnify:CR=1 FL=1